MLVKCIKSIDIQQKPMCQVGIFNEKQVISCFRVLSTIQYKLNKAHIQDHASPSVFACEFTWNVISIE